MGPIEGVVKECADENGQRKKNAVGRRITRDLNPEDLR